MPHLSLVCMVILAAFYFSFAWLTQADAQAEEETGDEQRVDDVRRPRLVAGKTLRSASSELAFDRSIFGLAGARNRTSRPTKSSFRRIGSHSGT